MKPDIPKQTRDAVMKRCDGNCEDCGKRFPLEMHHLRYETEASRFKDIEPIFGRETPGDLAALCRECHRSRHVDINGDFWRDPVEKESYWT